MGYETSICVLQRTILSNNSGLPFCVLIAHMDLSKCNKEFNALFDKKLFGYFYLPGNGNNHFEEDSYGEPAKEANLEHVYNWLGRHLFDAKFNNKFVYQRYMMLFKTLEHFVETKNEFWPHEELILARYGH